MAIPVVPEDVSIGFMQFKYASQCTCCDSSNDYIIKPLFVEDWRDRYNGYYPYETAPESEPVQLSTSGPSDVMDDPPYNVDLGEFPVMVVVPTIAPARRSNEATFSRRFHEDADVFYSTEGGMSFPEMHGEVRGRIAR